MRVLVAGIVVAMAAQPALAGLIGADDRKPLSDFAHERGWPQDLVDQIKANTVLERCFERVGSGPHKGDLDVIIGSAAVVGSAQTIVGSQHVMFDESVGKLRPPRLLARSGKSEITCAVRNFVMTDSEWLPFPEIGLAASFAAGDWDFTGDTVTPNANIGEDYSVLKPSEVLRGVAAPFPLASHDQAVAAREFFYVSADEDDLTEIDEPYIRECRHVLFDAFKGFPQVIDTDCDQGFGASGGALLAVDPASRVLVAVGECTNSPDDNVGEFKIGVNDTWCVALADPGPIASSARAAAALKKLASGPLLVDRNDAALKTLQLAVPRR